MADREELEGSASLLVPAPFYIGSWHPWFARHPVRLEDGRWTWLRRIERGRRSFFGQRWFRYRETTPVPG